MIFKKMAFQDYILFFLVIVAILTGQNILSQNGLEMILRNVTDTTLYTAAQSFVLMLGAIDLSQGAMVNLTNYYFVLIANNFGFWPAFFILPLIVGIIYFLIGFFIKKTQSDPFIVTLGLMFIYTGISENMLSIAKGTGKTIAANPEVASTLNTIFQNDFLGVQIGVLVLLILTITISYIIINRTNLGLFMISTGSSEKSASRMGINVSLVYGFTFAIASIFSCIGSIFEVSKTAQGSPFLANDLLFESIGAAVLGGIALSGGIGKTWIFMRGVLIFIVSEKALALTDLASDIRKIILGFIIILVVYLSNRKTKKEVA